MTLTVEDRQEQVMPTASISRDSNLDRELAERVQACLENLKEDEAVVRACLASLGEDGLRNYSYDYFYLNLLSILGGQRPVEEIRSLAAECTRSHLWEGWEYYSYLSKLPDLVKPSKAELSSEVERKLIRLKGWELDLLRSLLKRGKGLIICSHHIGAYRSIPTEMALWGFKVWVPLDELSFRQTYTALSSIHLKLFNGAVGDVNGVDGTAIPQNIRFLHVLSAEEKNSSITLMKALKRGEIVFVYIDGNTGWDGPQGSRSRSLIEFLHFPISVKQGVARLAAALGSPILPVLALQDQQDFGSLVFGHPIIPPGKLNGAERDEFIQETMQSLYRHLEPYALKYPQQWQGSCFLHRWRALVHQDQVLDSSALPSDEEEIAELLRLGKTFRLNDQRVASVSTQEGTVLVDVRTLRVYKNPDWAVGLLQGLRQQNGLNQSWLARQSSQYPLKDQTLNLLAYFKRQGLITVC